jgi:uncharacterized protein
MKAVWHSAWAAQRANFTTHCHGIDHWTRVERNGLWLASQLPGVDTVVVRLFAAIHDCRREDDGGDRYHGPRAADYARALDLPLREGQLERLLTAVSTHTFGPTDSEDLTVRVCHDADRLDLGRVGTRPKARFLSTAPAKDLAERDAIESLDGEDQDVTCPEHFVPTPRWDRG